MNKEYVAHIDNEILFSHKEEWNNAIASNMNTTRDYHTKWSKSERERLMPYYIICMCNLKKAHKNLRYRNRLTDRENRCSCQGGEGLGEG